MGFLGIGNKKQKKAAAAAQATLDKLIASGQKLSDENIQLAMLSADGKISTKDKKLLKKANKQAAKTERVEIRAERSMTNAATRAHAREVAYENGMDPRKWISDSLGEVAKGVVGVAAAGAVSKVGVALAGRPTGGGNSSADEASEYYGQEGYKYLQDGNGNRVTPEQNASLNSYLPDDPKQKNMLILGAVAVVIFFLLNKKK